MQVFKSLDASFEMFKFKIEALNMLLWYLQELQLNAHLFGLPVDLNSRVVVISLRESWRAKSRHETREGPNSKSQMNLPECCTSFLESQQAEIPNSHFKIGNILQNVPALLSLSISND